MRWFSLSPFSFLIYTSVYLSLCASGLPTRRTTTGSSSGVHAPPGSDICNPRLQALIAAKTVPAGSTVEPFDIRGVKRPACFANTANEVPAITTSGKGLSQGDALLFDYTEGSTTTTQTIVRCNSASHYMQWRTVIPVCHHLVHTEAGAEAPERQQTNCLRRVKSQPLVN